MIDFTPEKKLLFIIAYKSTQVSQDFSFISQEPKLKEETKIALIDLKSRRLYGEAVKKPNSKQLF